MKYFGMISYFFSQEICQRPKFIAEGATRFDVEQGEVGDPWLLAAVSSLTLTPRFLDRVVPPDQNFEHGYCGVFRQVTGQVNCNNCVLVEKISSVTIR